MRFDWNPDKHERNQRERGFGLDFAALIFEGDTNEWADDRWDYGEARLREIGEADGVVLHVVLTGHGDVCRIISARPASRRERDQWHASR